MLPRTALTRIGGCIDLLVTKWDVTRITIARQLIRRSTGTAWSSRSGDGAVHRCSDAFSVILPTGY
jgi:hypothetical protein